LTLQALHELSDRECAEAVRCDLRWKVACGLSLLDEGFDPSSLTYWRQRIAKSERPHRINDAIRQVIEATGVLAGRRAGRWTPRSLMTRWPLRTPSRS
jgi:IS5 family transposase